MYSPAIVTDRFLVDNYNSKTTSSVVFYDEFNESIMFIGFLKRLRIYSLNILISGKRSKKFVYLRKKFDFK
jgi:hypothetical protein